MVVASVRSTNGSVGQNVFRASFFNGFGVTPPTYPNLVPDSQIGNPDHPDVQGVTFTEFAMPFDGPDTVSRNAVVVAPGRLDRSPCGTGTCARLAVLHARGRLAVGQGFVHESIIGSRFEAAIAGETRVGSFTGVVPTIAGQAWITGVFQHGLDPSDPFPRGYTLPDLWGT